MWELRPLEGDYTVTAKYLTLFPSASDLLQLLSLHSPMPTPFDDPTLAKILSWSYPDYSVTVETLKNSERGG